MAPASQRCLRRAEELCENRGKLILFVLLPTLLNSFAVICLVPLRWGQRTGQNLSSRHQAHRQRRSARLGVQRVAEQHVLRRLRGRGGGGRGGGVWK